MNASELRIGNYISHPNSDLSEIEEIFQKNGEYAIKPKNYHIGYFLANNDEELIKPIKLTEEWLLKAGFENNTTYEFSKGNFHITGDIRAFYFSLPFMNGITLKYVHELQNLYFALCGEELVFSTEP